MTKLDREYLEYFITLLEKADTGGTAGVPGEPLTLHRRGHWFEPSIAHIGTHTDLQNRFKQLLKTLHS